MLYHLLYFFRHEVSALNVVRYITFRTAVASLTALFLVLVLGPWMIERLRRLQIGQYIREEGPQEHKLKAGTPTMGGVLILTGILVPTLLWSDLTNRSVWILILSTLAFGAIGFADDYIKVRKRRNLGLTAKAKFGLQFVAAAIMGGALLWLPGFDTDITFPFFKQLYLPLGAFYIVFVMIVLVGASNAVNLTDGLDGLAIGTTSVAAATYALFTYIAGNVKIASYLQVAHVPGVGEVAVFCGALFGAGLGFLWYNSHPAEVFMGDVGSLALGGGIGAVAVLAKQEILLVLVGGVFVMEALSVILQVISFKLRGKRIFRMSPIHHHFELIGWAEPKVIVRFWILSILFALLSLSTLKLR
jgi:phospho-N-acetylmuramoyl-pentapeptide-transferase